MASFILLVLLFALATSVQGGTVKPGEIKGPIVSLCGDQACTQQQCGAHHCHDGQPGALPSLTCVTRKGSYVAYGKNTDRRSASFESIWPRIYYSAKDRVDGVVFDFYDTKNCTGRRFSYSKATVLPVGSCRGYRFTFYDDDGDITYNHGMITYPQWQGTDKDPLRCVTGSPTIPPPTSNSPTPAPVRIVEPGEIPGPIVTLCGEACVPYSTCRFEKCPAHAVSRAIPSLTCTDVPGRVRFGASTWSFKSVWTRVFYQPRAHYSQYGSRGSDRITHDFYTTRNCSGRRNTYHRGAYTASGDCRLVSFKFSGDPHQYVAEIVQYPEWQGTNKTPLICGVDARPTISPTSSPTVAPGSPTKSPTTRSPTLTPRDPPSFHLATWHVVLLGLAGAHALLLVGYGIWRCCEHKATQKYAPLPLAQFG